MTLRIACLAAALGGLGTSGLLGCSDGAAASPRFDAGHLPDAPFDADEVDATEPGDGNPCNTGGQSGTTCEPFLSCADLAGATVSFAADLAPVLNSTCGIGGSTCHGDPKIVPYFDVAKGGAAFVLSSAVNHPAPEDPAIDIITPGQPDAGMFMHKLDGDACLLAAACNAAAADSGVAVFAECGQRMPINAPQLSLATRDTFRRWIAQGAQNN